MEWVFRSPQIHSTFSNLGFMHADGYHVNKNCNAALETILHNILTEDKYLRAYRRSISFGQNIQKDLIPLLIHAKEDKTIELLVTILVNLSIPIECLLCVEVTSQSDLGLHTVFEINQLLTTTKAAFTGQRATKVLVDFLTKNVVPDQPKVSPEQCINIRNSLQLLRNILHIPEEVKSPSPENNGSRHAVQNQILWNMFSGNILDKVLIKLMTIPEATNWGVTMVQLVGLLYKDQHVVTLQKLLNIWLESCNSESSEDNESNTSPPDRGIKDSSPMLISDSTSDSSDTGGSGKCNDEPNSVNNGWGASSENATMKDANQPFQPPLADGNEQMRDQGASTGDDNMSDNVDKKVPKGSKTATTKEQQPEKIEKKAVISETSDCGYGTQILKQESISTSSNDGDIPSKKPVHQKPHNPKQRVNTKARTGVTLLERKRKKIVKRGKVNIIHVQGIKHHTPSDDDISNVLKEFTVDFLLKGYNSLVQTLHSQILTNLVLEIDTSHFFWLVTYFLKFAIQIELDIEQISAVLSFDMISYMTAEGVNLCEQFELAVKLDENDLMPSRRRLHLVVTAIREYVQAIQTYIKFPHICADDKDYLLTLQNKICDTEELRSLLVLLLRHYNPILHTKQYLQDLIITNHILLTFVDNAMRDPNYTGSINMADHIKQFATAEIMCQYGLLLEDYAVNSEFTNDCVFTIMHHVAGELDSLTSLYQPKILKTFTSIWKSEFQICDDWFDLIEYVIKTFIKKTQELQPNINNLRMDIKKFDDEKFSSNQPAVVTSAKEGSQTTPEVEKNKSAHRSTNLSSKERWTEGELSSLSWIYLQCNTPSDVIGEIIKCLKEEGKIKSRDSVIKELYKQNIINKEEFEKLSKAELKTGKSSRDSKMPQHNKEREVEIGKLCEQLRKDGKNKSIDWVQQVLLEICYAKLQIEKRYRDECLTSEDQWGILKFKLFTQEYDSPVVSPVSYHALLLNRSVPLVPWNCEQATMCKDLKFLQLLYKLGFQMPADSGKVFIRIPHVWSADLLYEVAGRVAVIDTTKLKFSICDITSSRTKSTWQSAASASLIYAPDNFYQIHKQKHFADIVNITPRPGSSLNSDTQSEANKRCWLEVVQQSQELKLTCTVGSVLSSVEVLTEAETDPALQAAPTPDLLETMPPKDFITHLSELEDNNSVSDTASVASDLTCMYVSDEDEKLELALRPRIKSKPIIAEGTSDTEPGASKRHRGFDTTL